MLTSKKSVEKSYAGRREGRQGVNFLAQIQSALAATPGNGNAANERQAMGLDQQNPSFTIPLPQG